MDDSDPRGQENESYAAQTHAQELSSWTSFAEFPEDVSNGPVGSLLEEKENDTKEKNSSLGIGHSVVTLSREAKSSPHSSQETILSRKSAGEFCRICHDQPSVEKFISPCFCKGTLSQVHKSCLERWLAESDSSQCELCGFRYRVERCPKYSILMSVVAWLSSRSTWRERRSLVVDVIALLILCPVVCLSTMMALQLVDTLFALDHDQGRQPKETNSMIADMDPRRSVEMLGTMMARVGQMGVISMILTMDMAFVSWLAMRLQYHVTTWYSWYRRNCKVTLVEQPRLNRHPVPSTSSAASIGLSHI